MFRRICSVKHRQIQIQYSWTNRVYLLEKLTQKYRETIRTENDCITVQYMFLILIYDFEMQHLFLNKTMIP